MKTPRLYVFLWAVVCSAAFWNSELIAADTPGVTAYISTGDNQWVLWLPMDSKASIDTAIDTAARDFHVTRLWWRGGGDEANLNTLHSEGLNILLRPSNHFFSAMFRWTKECLDQRGTNRAAIAAARRHGMSIYSIWGIYDFESAADAGACIQYPYMGEDALRVKHPEWIPVNKYGTRRQNGPLEFAYPECRAAVAKALADFVEQYGYDGLCLYTYNENFTLRYPDEFGYSQPIVDEFKRRYDVDIRTQPFDRDAWARLRGEYFTSLLADLKARLASHQKKLVVWVSADDSHSPMTWHSGGLGKTRTAGHIYMDWKEWVRRDAVDELCVYWPGDDDTLRDVQSACTGSNVTVSMFRTHGSLPPGVTRVVGLNDDVESGYTPEANIGWPTEHIQPEPAMVLREGDAYAKRRALYCVAHGLQTVPDPELVAATKDPDLYVRRAALRALAISKSPLAERAALEALKDPENSVQCQAAVVLGQLGNASAIDPIFDAAKSGTFQFNYVAALGALTALGPKNIDAVAKRVGDPDPNVRRLALQTLEGVPTGTFPSVRQVSMQIAAGDADPWVRELALGALARYTFDPEVVSLMITSLNGADETEQTRAAVYLTWVVSTAPATPFNPAVGKSAKTLPDSDQPEEARLDDPFRFALADDGSKERSLQMKALDSLLTLFKKYGDGCRRSDADWGWRPVGNSILCFGDTGREELQKIIDEDQDQRLAELAWRVVYLRQRVMSFCPSTETEDALAHLHRPKHMQLATAQ
jgi:HEAT repeat protein